MPKWKKLYGLIEKEFPETGWDGKGRACCFYGIRCVGGIQGASGDGGDDDDFEVMGVISGR